MKKIVSLFKRDYEGTRLIYDEIVPGAEWVIAGEGVATLKYDGTACLVKGGVLYKRYDSKRGRVPPSNWEPCEDAPDPVSGHWPGWLPVGEGPEDRWHREAWQHLNRAGIEVVDWTYELVGPRVQGNAYDLDRHILWRHGHDKMFSVPRTFDGLKEWFARFCCEGIVWWRDPEDVDSEKVKVKRKDFGLPWPGK